jgi:hypothetical protein
MKRCPQCNRAYTDDGLSFCLDDGSPLLSASAPPLSDPSATVQYPQARDTSAQATIAFNPAQVQQAPPPISSAPPPAWSPMPPPAAEKRSIWPWVLGIGAVLVLVLIGGGILIFVALNVTNTNNNNGNSNNSNSRVANRNTNKNTNTDETNTNTNSRSTLSSFKDDFSDKKAWGTGESQYGNIWYQDEEYHMHATKGGFIVMYGPDKSDYRDENATVRIGLRSIDGSPPLTGYGLVVHGEKKDGKLEDYGFLIYNGDVPKYKIVLHKAGAETKIVDWTATSTIRSGTAPNQIEVRIRDTKMDFYINGQFATSVVDTETYKRGRVGLYTSDVGEVAFDDLEISK